ncbi:MAG: PEGA domain-containing protein [Spirochaetales bacterium]|nr:PEGA domain-containing protein [Spirochaetales bacterium]MCF7937527.1 PEGA domain-containing protein [Spirochaetales bacterium]
MSVFSKVRALCSRGFAISVLSAAFFLLLSTGSGGGLWAEGREAAILFVNSSPIRAGILIDGEDTGMQTPAVFHTLPAGEHDVLLVKPGFRDTRRTVVLTAGTPAHISPDLEEYTITLGVAGEERVRMAGGEVNTRENYLRLPEGAYRFSREPEGQEDRMQDDLSRETKNLVSIEPVYPKESLIEGLEVMVPLMFLFSTALAVNDVVEPSESELFFRPMTFASYSLSAAGWAYLGMLERERQEFYQALPLGRLDRSKSLARAAEVYDLGDEYLSLGRLADAIKQFTLVVERYPDSPLVPKAIYKTGKIHIIQGNTDYARETFQLILQEYPTVRTYDKARQELADLYTAQGRYGEALAELDSMVFLDPLFSRAEVSEQKVELRTMIGDGGGK